MAGAAALEAEIGLRPEHPGLLPSTLLGAAADGGSPRRSLRDWIVDVVCFLLALGTGALTFSLAADLLTAPLWLTTADALLGLAACVSLWWRRRWPVHIAVALAVVTVVSALAGVAAMIAIFTVGVHRRFSVVAAVAGLHVVTGTANLIIRPDPSFPWWTVALLQLPMLAALVAWGMFVRARRQLVFSLRDRAHRAEAEQRLRIEQARHLERTRIAREMHDVLAHRISLVSVHAGALEMRSPAVPPDVARSAAVIRESAHEALQDLRAILGVLRAEVAEEEPERPQPTLADLPRLIDEAQRAGTRVSYVRTVADPVTVPAGVGRTAYRVVQEGLTNVRKHAPGAEATVRVSGGAGDGLTVEVTNRGPVGHRGEPRVPGAGLGLAGLAERAGLTGGRLEHGTTPSGDFRLAAWLPWPT